MRKVILSVALLLASGVFTSCTDLSEDIVPNKIESELQGTGGEETQDPDEEDEVPTKGGRYENIDTGGEDGEDPDPDPDSKESIYTGGGEDPTPVEDDED
ncbi:hypothetical protein [Tenacibaculum discolor]|uniref:hypothetical protein n=1 Tax=Tenacibaculum discolor TaxID=361581 RepID=UPI003F791D14